MLLPPPCRGTCPGTEAHPGSRRRRGNAPGCTLGATSSAAPLHACLIAPTAAREAWRCPPLSRAQPCRGKAPGAAAAAMSAGESVHGLLRVLPTSRAVVRLPQHVCRSSAARRQSAAAAGRAVDARVRRTAGQREGTLRELPPSRPRCSHAAAQVERQASMCVWSALLTRRRRTAAASHVSGFGAVAFRALLSLASPMCRSLVVVTTRAGMRYAPITCAGSRGLRLAEG